MTDTAVHSPTHTSDSLGSTRARTRRLPSLEPATHFLLELLRDPDVDVRRVLDTLERDVALSGNVLAVANSAYYGVSREVDSLRMAMRVLGFDALRHLLYATTVQRLFRQGQLCAGFHARCLWRHSATTAALARKLATMTGTADPQAAFLGGLLHDVGHIIAAQLDRKAFCSLISAAGAPLAGGEEGVSGSFYLAAERDVLGTTHAQLGAETLTKWCFPDWAIRVVAAHHEPPSAATGISEDASLLEVVRAADQLSGRLPGSFGLDVGFEAGAVVDVAALPAVTALKLETGALERLIDEVQVMEFA